MQGAKKHFSLILSKWKLAKDEGKLKPACSRWRVKIKIAAVKGGKTNYFLLSITKGSLPNSFYSKLGQDKAMFPHDVESESETALSKNKCYICIDISFYLSWNYIEHWKCIYFWLKTFPQSSNHLFWNDWNVIFSLNAVSMHLLCIDFVFISCHINNNRSMKCSFW